MGGIEMNNHVLNRVSALTTDCVAEHACSSSQPFPRWVADVTSPYFDAQEEGYGTMVCLNLHLRLRRILCEEMIENVQYV